MSERKKRTSFGESPFKGEGDARGTRVTSLGNPSIAADLLRATRLGRGWKKSRGPSS